MIEHTIDRAKLDHDLIVPITRHEAPGICFHLFLLYPMSLVIRELGPGMAQALRAR